VHGTGLQVVATISDQRRAIEGAISILKNETKSYYLQTNGNYRNDVYEVEIMKNSISKRVKIVHLFDVPHLMKCILNNLLTKDLNFTINGVKRTPKWYHLIQLYKVDGEISDSKMLPRLTDCHILPHKITKMKVKCATQVFSQRVSAVLNFLASELNKKSM